MTPATKLTAKLLDGTLTDSEWAELHALVASEPVAEADHLALLELEASLRGLRTNFDLADATLARVQAEQADRTADAVLAQLTTAPAPGWAAPAPAAPRPPRRRGMWVGLGVLAACAAAIIVAVWLNGKPPVGPGPDPDRRGDPTAFAMLAHKAGAVEVLSPSGELVPTDEGAALPPGATVRTVGDDSLAIVELLQYKTRVEIESDSVVRFTGTRGESSGKSWVFLASGQLTAAVLQRPEDQPLIVGTAVAEVFAREGTFVVSSAGPESARVDIKQGNVELLRTAAPKRIPLGVGGAAVVFAGIDRLDIERALRVDRNPRRTLQFPAPRDAIFSPGGEEVWVANARVFSRWPESGKAKDTSFYPRRGNDGIAAFSRDKQYLFTFRPERNERVLVRTLPDGGEHAAINARPQDPRLWTAAPDGSWLAVVDPRPNNRRLHAYDGGSGEELFIRDFEDQITCVTATPDGKALAVGTIGAGRGSTNKVVVLDARSGDRQYALSVLKRPITALRFSPDGRYLATGFNGMIQLWDVHTRELVRSVAGFERALTCLAFSPDGKRLAGGTHDGHVWVWDADTGKHTQLIDVGGRGVRSVAFSPNGKQLVTVANSAPVAVWEVADGFQDFPKFQ